jgi:hypothetical protein
MERIVSHRRAAWHSSAANYNNTAHLVTEGLCNPLETGLESGWISGGSGIEWLYIDLGCDTRVSAVTVYWGEAFAVSYSIQGSNDAVAWTTLSQAAGTANSRVTTALSGARARYVRILCRRASGVHYHILTVERVKTTWPRRLIYCRSPTSTVQCT